MKIRLNDDYYFWCCDWCDSENLVLWTKLQSGTNCGACHRPMNLQDMNDFVINSTIAASETPLWVYPKGFSTIRSGNQL